MVINKCVESFNKVEDRQHPFWKHYKAWKLWITCLQSTEQELIYCSDQIQSISKTNSDLDLSIFFSSHFSIKNAIPKTHEEKSGERVSTDAFDESEK